MKVYIISIRPERLKRCLSRLPDTQEYVVVGVDGRGLDRPQLINDGVYHPLNQFHLLTRGELGCFLSHRAAWEQILEANDDMGAIIIEDDYMLDPEVIQQAELHYNNVRVSDPKWNILQLIRMTYVREDVKIISRSYSIPGRSWGLAGYIVSLSGCQALLNLSKPIEEAVDTFVSTANIPGKYALIKDIGAMDDTVLSDTVGIE